MSIVRKGRKEEGEVDGAWTCARGAIHSPRKDTRTKQSAFNKHPIQQEQRTNKHKLVSGVRLTHTRENAITGTSRHRAFDWISHSQSCSVGKRSVFWSMHTRASSHLTR